MSGLEPRGAKFESLLGDHHRGTTGVRKRISVSIINVNGTSIQSAADRAQPGDTLAVAAGGYSGFKLTKKLTVAGDGNVTVESPSSTIDIAPTAAGSVLSGLLVRGSTNRYAADVLVRAADVLLDNLHITDSQCFGIRLYAADRLHAKNILIERIAAGVEIHNGGAGSVFDDVVTQDIDRMVVMQKDGDPNGGDAWQFYKSTGPILLNRPKVFRARAKTDAIYQYDGGAFEFYDNCRNVTIDSWEVHDSVHVIETGRAASGLDPSGIIIKNGKAFGNPNTLEPPAGTGVHESPTSSVGFFLRSNIGFEVSGNEFRDLDWFVFHISGPDSYSGSQSGNKLINNKIWLKPGGVNKAYEVGNVDLARFGTIDGNQVYFDSARVPVVASIDSRGGTNNLATWRSWTNQSANDFWGTESTPSTCAQDLAKARADLLDLQSRFDDMSLQRDEACEAYNDAIDRIDRAKLDLG